MMEHLGTDRMIDIEENERLRTFVAIMKALSFVEADSLDIDSVLPQILQLTREHLSAEIGSLIVVNPAGEIEYAWLFNQQFPQIHVASKLTEVSTDSLAGWTLRHQKTLIIDNSQHDNRRILPQDDPVSDRSYSALCTPFLLRNRAIGTLTLAKSGIEQFDQHDADLAEAIANQAAHIIENARLFAETQRQLSATKLLHEAAQTINTSLDIDEIMRRLLAKMNEFLRTEAVSIALVEPGSNELVYKAAEGAGGDKIVGLRVPSNQGLSGWVMKHGQPALVADTSKDLRFQDRLGKQRTGYDTQAMICAPIVYKDTVLGTIQAINPLESTFTQQDLDVLISLANVAGSAIDNAQKHADTQAAEARYTSLFQDSVDPILLTDLAGNIVEANLRAVTFLGYSRDDLLQMTIAELHKLSANLPSVDAIRGTEAEVFSSTVIPGNGRSPLYMKVYCKRTLSGSNELLQWIHHDITKQVQLDEMRQDLTAMLVHDLQSPLGNVISSLELLKNDMPQDGSRVQLMMLDIAVRSSNHLQTLVRSLIDISRLEAGHPITKQESVDIFDLITIVYDIEEPHFERRGVDLLQEIDPAAPQVFVEESLIRRVLLNLLDNALKYGQSNTQVTFTSQALPDQNMVLLTLCDKGPGVPEDDRQRIFEKFQRINTGTESKGLGSGLAFCRLAVEAHGGKIWVENAPSGGACFKFTVPALPQNVAISA